MSTAAKYKKIAMVKMAQKQLNIDDETYRAMLFRLTEKTSCKDMTLREINSVLDEMIKKGFVVKPKNPTHSTPVKTPLYVHADERDKVLSLWIALADIGVVKNRSDKALATYCKKLTGKAHWHFQADYMTVIEGLKAWYWREALKQLCDKLGIVDIMSIVRQATADQRISRVHQNARTVNKISSAMSEHTFLYIACRFQIDDPVEYIKEGVHDATEHTKTA